MYEGYKLCPDLRASDVCVVVEQYREGLFERQFHQHFPKFRMSQERRLELLRALVARYYGGTGMGFDLIVNCHLNTRGRNPPAGAALRIVTSYPEAGVLRQYCGGDTCAWCDVVVLGSSFRAETKKNKNEEESC